MPTIHREAGFRFAFFANEHPPPHVHVTSGNGAMKVFLGDEDTPPTICSAVGMKPGEIKMAFQIILANKVKFLAKWRHWHG